MREGTETVLLVDDEDIVIGVGRQMLEKLGFSVLTAKTRQEALDVFGHQPEAIDLVVLDMIMPGMDAGETYDSLKQINPGVKVLLSSGYSIDQKTSEILNRGCNGFIQKPFNLKVLGEMIGEILGARPQSHT